MVPGSVLGYGWCAVWVLALSDSVNMHLFRAVFCTCILFCNKKLTVGLDFSLQPPCTPSVPPSGARVAPLTGQCSFPHHGCFFCLNAPLESPRQRVAVLAPHPGWLILGPGSFHYSAQLLSHNPDGFPLLRG